MKKLIRAMVLWALKGVSLDTFIYMKPKNTELIILGEKENTTTENSDVIVIENDIFKMEISQEEINGKML